MAKEAIDQIDLAFLREAFASRDTAGLVPWIEPLKATCQEFGISTVREVASFFANVAVESGDLRKQSENLNYSQEGLEATFGRHRISLEDCLRLGRKPDEKVCPPERQRQIANLIYGGDWGKVNLGNVRGDDGWIFRGAGLNQISGREVFMRVAEKLNMPLGDVPAYARTTEGACRTAGAYWKLRNMDRYAATPGFTDDRKRLNGGDHGLHKGKAVFNRLVDVLLERGC